MTALIHAEETAVKNDDAKGTFWTGTSLIAGTCIGGGMLAMPVQTAEVGFFLSFLALAACWAFMTFTGLLLVEATLWIKNETHFSSLSHALIGNWVKVIALVIYLFMNYASLVAYTAGGAALINMWGDSWFGFNLGYEMSCCVFTLLFGSMIYVGSVFLGKINFWLMIALAICYVFLVAISFSGIKGDNLVVRWNWVQSFGTFSMILATFSYQMVIPAVCVHMKYDVKRLKRAVITGTTIPFLIYALWIFVIHGAVTLDGEHGLREAWTHGHAATVPLRKQLNHWIITVIADSFAFLAVATSYLGLTFALFYFLKDCFNNLKIQMKSGSIILMTVFPSLILAILFPRALLTCLDLSGGFGDTILSGLIPIALVWVGRYRKNLDNSGRVPGGKPALILSAVFFFSILLLQFF